MIEMIKGNTFIKVPNTTAKIYESLGYKKAADIEAENVQPEAVEESATVDYTDKPIAKWTSAELKEYVKEHDIDVSGAKKTAEVREIVKAYLED